MAGSGINFLGAKIMNIEMNQVESPTEQSPQQINHSPHSNIEEMILERKCKVYIR
jgi:hypothetical protein